jgi:hypothetical protein
MEKQRDKAARRMQRKAQRQAGGATEEPDEFGVLEASGEAEPGEPESGEPQAGEDQNA